MDNKVALKKQQLDLLIIKREGRRSLVQKDSHEDWDQTWEERKRRAQVSKWHFLLSQYASTNRGARNTSQEQWIFIRQTFLAALSTLSYLFRWSSFLRIERAAFVRSLSGHFKPNFSSEKTFVHFHPVPNICLMKRKFSILSRCAPKEVIRQGCEIHFVDPLFTPRATAAPESITCGGVCDSLGWTRCKGYKACKSVFVFESVCASFLCSK